MPHHPVILVHGFLDTGAVFRRVERHLIGEGRKTYAMNLRPNDGRAGLESLAGQLDHFARATIPGERFDLIGFSMGGLIARYYVQRLGGIDHVGRLITLASPHQGTVWSHIAPLKGLRQMRPGSAFIEDLNRDAGMLRQVGFVSLWTPYDLMVFPARRAMLDDHPAIRLPVIAHPLMLADRRVLATISDLLNSPGPDDTPSS